MYYFFLYFTVKLFCIQGFLFLNVAEALCSYMNCLHLCTSIKKDCGIWRICSSFWGVIFPVKISRYISYIEIQKNISRYIFCSISPSPTLSQVRRQISSTRTNLLFSQQFLHDHMPGAAARDAHVLLFTKHLLARAVLSGFFLFFFLLCLLGCSHSCRQ